MIGKSNLYFSKREEMSRLKTFLRKNSCGSPLSYRLERYRYPVQFIGEDSLKNREVYLRMD